MPAPAQTIAPSPLTDESVGRYNGDMPKPKYLGYEEVAALLDVKVTVVRKYLAEARKHREEGVYVAHDMPEPDHTFGQSPAWLPKTIEAWQKKRPGRGAGGGRKPREKVVA